MPVPSTNTPNEASQPCPRCTVYPSQTKAVSLPSSP